MLCLLHGLDTDPASMCLEALQHHAFKSCALSAFELAAALPKVTRHRVSSVLNNVIAVIAVPHMMIHNELHLPMHALAIESLAFPVLLILMGSMYEVLKMVEEFSCQIWPVHNNEAFPLHWIVVLEQLQSLAVLLQLLVNLHASQQHQSRNLPVTAMLKSACGAVQLFTGLLDDVLQSEQSIACGTS